MSNLNTTAYIKKLVKIIYEKQKQIQNLKQTLKTQPSIQISSTQQLYIDPQLKNELQQTSHQLKSVNKQILTMQGKIVELSIGLKEQLQKNGKLEQETMQLKEQQKRLRKEIQHKNIIIQQNKQDIKDLRKRLESNFQDQQKFVVLKKRLNEELSALKQERIKQRYEHTLILKQLNVCKAQLKKKEHENKLTQNQLNQKTKENQVLKIKFQTIQIEQKQLKCELSQLSETIEKLQIEKRTLRQQIESTNKMHKSEIQLLGQKVKDYKQFALEISHYVQASYAKHCNKFSLRSSKKLIRQNSSFQSRCEATLSKMNQIQQCLDNMAQKIQKVLKDQEIPVGTLQNLSLIAHSFEEKLQLCDLTERIEKDRIQMLKNEQELLNKMQKQCQKSYERQRSKVLQLGQLKQILKMTKEVNRELMDEVNKNEHIIKECRKVLVQVISNKSNPEFRAIRTLLGINKQ